MKSPLKFLAAFFAAFCVTLAAFAAEASPAGTWKWTVQGRQGGQGFEQTLKLDYKDGKLTGTVLGTNAGQFQIPDTEISDASFKDGVIKFSVTREFNGNKFTSKYEGKLEGDTIKGTSERPGMNGGEPTKREWNAKRQK
jgi:hypothetical protein